jgi:hypothetical protein
MSRIVKALLLSGAVAGGTLFGGAPQAQAQAGWGISVYGGPSYYTPYYGGGVPYYGGYGGYGGYGYRSYYPSFNFGYGSPYGGYYGGYGGYGHHHHHHHGHHGHW